MEPLGCFFHSNPALRDGLASAAVGGVDYVFLAAVGAGGEFGAVAAGPTRPSATTTVVGGGGEDADLLLLLLDGHFRVGEQCAHLDHRISRVSRDR